EPHLPAPPTHSTPAPTSLLFLLTLRPPPQPPLFPYTTLLSRDEHAPPGRAPGDGSRNRPRPGGGPAPRGRRRVAPVGSRCDRPARRRDRAPDLRRGPRDEFSAVARNDHPARAADRRGAP